MKDKLITPIPMLIAGVILGIISKLLDIYTENIGNIFSELSIWILVGVLITINSTTQKRACLNVFLFCIGMLISYYTTAVLSSSIYSQIFIYGWTVFSLLSPIFAYITYLTKENNILSKIISVGIMIVTVMSNILIFDGPRVHDFIIYTILIYILFSKKTNNYNKKNEI